MSSTSSSRLCSCFRSMWASTVQFIVLQDESVRRRRRLLLGIVVLLLVDVLWVGSSELTDFIFKYEGFDKPFFTTFFKTSSFMIYLTGFLFYEPWRLQCLACLKNETSSNNEPTFEEMTDEDISASRSAEVASSSFEIIPRPRRVTFSSVREVRQLSDHNSEQEKSTRLPYHLGEDQKLPVHRAAKVTLLFCLLWFCANCSYQEAIVYTSPAAVNI
ncbi:solute carrier family 35 member F5-like isoform X2 [Porites lutea]|uniref:solute carrier family 35 member F5-like isoform X2 n=1 Tax=Porites lutea TaxID=51062 RepID=UPI003CC6B2FB